MIVIWIIGLVGGLTATVIASSYALDSGSSLAQKAGLSPFLIGMTVMAVGTDLPEIANSITASATNHGDVNVGDSIGSVVTQMTFVLGILCLFRGVRSERRLAIITGAAIVASLVLGVGLVADNELSRLDGLILIQAWIIGTYVVHTSARMDRTQQPRLFNNAVAKSLTIALVSLAAVGAGALVAVLSFTEIATILGVPEYATSFFVLSIGTSLPELVVDGRALKQGHSRLAMGDLLGSSFVDATLSLGIGPLLFPTVLSSEVQRGSIAATVAVALAILLLVRSSEHRWLTGTALLLIYLSLYAWMLVP